MRLNRVLLTAIAVTFSAFAAVAQGLYVESKGSDGDKIEKFWYRPQMFRSTGDDGNATVVRLDRDVMYHIDSEKRTYTEMTFAEMKGMRDKAAAMLKKRMESMSPEQKQKMEEMMKKMQGMAPEQRKALEGRMGVAKQSTDDNNYEVVKTGEKKSISGFACTKYIVKRHGGETETVWATTDIGGSELLRKDMELFMKKVSMNSRTGNTGNEWYAEIPGFPVQTESHGSTRTVTKVEKRAINVSEFEVPAGYTKTKMKGFDEQDQEGKD